MNKYSCTFCKSEITVMGKNEEIIHKGEIIIVPMVYSYCRPEETGSLGSGVLSYDVKLLTIPTTGGKMNLQEIEVKQVEFTVGELEFSETMEEKYTWDELMAIQWPDGWRVPEEAELLRLYDREPYSHFYKFYWSAISFADNSAPAWGVDFGNGYKYYDDRNSKNHVRLVRTIIKPIGPLL